MDQAPDWPRAAMLHVPLTISPAAFSNMVTRPELGLRPTLDAQVPEYSPPWPVTFARQAPLQWSFALTADQPPNATVFPSALASVHVPVTAPLVLSGTDVHVPMNVLLPLVALHVPDRAPRINDTESRRTTCRSDGPPAAMSKRQVRKSVFTELSERRRPRDHPGLKLPPLRLPARGASRTRRSPTDG